MPSRDGLHLAQLLVAAGRQADAVTQAALVLTQDPQNAAARGLMAAAITGSEGPFEAAGVDWSAMEDELAEVVPPQFVRSGDTPNPVAGVADRTFDVETVVGAAGRRWWHGGCEAAPGAGVSRAAA